MPEIGLPIIMSCSPVGSQTLTLKWHRIFSILLTVLQNLTMKIYRYSTELSNGTWRNKVVINFKTSSLLHFFHRVGWCQAYYQRRKVIFTVTQLWTMQNTIMCNLTRDAQLCNSDMEGMLLTNHFMMSSKFLQDITHLIVLIGQETVRCVVIGLREEANIIILVNRHNINIIPNHLSLYPLP